MIGEPWRTREGPSAARPQPAPRPRSRAPLRVAIDARKLTDAESGIGSYTLNLVQGLLREDVDLELLLLRHGRGRQARFEDPRVAEVHVPLYADSPLGPLTLGPVLARHRFDVFHSPFDHVPRGLAQPVVVTIHDVNDSEPGVQLPNSSCAWGRIFIAPPHQSMHEANAHRHSNATATPRRVEPWHEPKIRVVYTESIGAGSVRRRGSRARARDRSGIPHLRSPGVPYKTTSTQCRAFRGVSGSARLPQDPRPPSEGGTGPNGCCEIRSRPR